MGKFKLGEKVLYEGEECVIIAVEVVGNGYLISRDEGGWGLTSSDYTGKYYTIDNIKDYKKAYHITDMTPHVSSVKKGITLEVGKWYVYDTCIFNYQKGSNCYGWDTDNSPGQAGWVTNPWTWSGSTEGVRLAKIEDVKYLLLERCNKLYPKGTEFKCAFEAKHDRVVENSFEVEENSGDGSFYVSQGSGCVYDDTNNEGFAEIKSPVKKSSCHLPTTEERPYRSVTITPSQWASKQADLYIYLIGAPTTEEDSELFIVKKRRKVIK